MLGDSRNENRHQVNEMQRIYIFPNNETLQFDNVESIAISSSGNHYLNLQDGIKAIVRCGWLAVLIHGEWIA